MVLVGLTLTTGSGCSKSASSGYPSANALPKLPAGIRIVDATKVPNRDCEGPHCKLHITIAGPENGLTDLVGVMRSDGWKPQPTAYPGQVALCKNPGGLFADLSTKSDQIKAFPRTLAFWPTLDQGSLAVILEDGRGISCP
jgi:hypothetical protein